MDILRNAGRLPQGFASDPATTEIRNIPGSSIAALTTADGTTTLIVRETWEIIARERLGGDQGRRVAELTELDGLVALGADIVVTDVPDLLELRDDPLVQPLRLFTPEEALVIVGLWSRILHRAFVDGPSSVNNGLYYWSLARALTPAGWPAYCAFVRGQYVLADGPALFDLASSVFDRLSSGARALDRLTELSLCATSPDTNDEMLDELVQIVLNVWGAYDNVALLAGYYLNISLNRADRAKWSVMKKDWRVAMVGSQDERARRIAELVARDRSWFAISEQLRHQTIHRARLRQVTVERRSQREARIEVEGEVWESLKTAIGALGHTRSAWGIGDVFPPGTVHVTVEGTEARTETYNVHLGERALLDPVVIAPRLLAHAGRFANEVLAILSPHTDTRIPHADECDGPPDKFYFSPEGATAAIASSPLSGLVDWALQLDSV